MTNKKIWLGMMIIAFGIMLVGCNFLDTSIDPPTGLVATKLSDTNYDDSSNIHLTWDAVKGAKDYEIAYRTNLDSADTRRYVSHTGITTYTHYVYYTSDVTTLYYYVKAMNRYYSWEEGYKETDWSAPVSVYIR